MYHVGLELTPDQAKRLKQRALSCDATVKQFVTDLVIKEIDRECPSEGAENKEKGETRING